MAQHKTAAHTFARQRGFSCARCGHPLRNAKYEGEFLYPLTIVYLRCNRCHSLNEVNISRHDAFGDVVTDIDALPRQATKITVQAPVMAQGV